MEHDVHHAQVRSPAPDDCERDLREHAAPLERDAQAAQEGQDLVAQILAACETLVAVSPHTRRIL